MLNCARHFFSLVQLRHILLVAVAALALTASASQAQPTLSPALWQEQVFLQVGSEIRSYAGPNINAPEEHTETFSGEGFEVDGTCAFGTPGIPEATSQVAWDLSKGNHSLVLSTIVSIGFQMIVTETSTPPVAVEEVPVRVVIDGSADVTDVFGSRSTSDYRVQVVTTFILLSDAIDVSGDSDGPASATISIDQIEMIPLDTLTLINMGTSASMNTVSIDAPASGSATGNISTRFEIVDDTIPGTSSSYRDFFTLEYSEGYDAMTPVEPVSIGQLKTKFDR